VEVLGLVLLHPNLSGRQVPAFTRLLAGSSLGRSMLRPLLRSEVRASSRDVLALAPVACAERCALSELVRPDTHS
jgi:hypothetical protein